MIESSQPCNPGTGVHHFPVGFIKRCCFAKVTMGSKRICPDSERFCQTIKFECLNKMILTSEDQLRYVIKEFMIHYHRERPHMGLGGKLIDPWPQDEDGEIVEFERLGGLLRSYRRVKKAA